MKQNVTIDSATIIICMPLDFLQKNEIPKSLPKSMEMVVQDLKNSSNQEECLNKAYTFLSTKYHGHRFSTYLKLFQLFNNNIFKLWNRSGFMHCTNINYLLRILLVKSGHFTKNEVCFRWTFVWYLSPHQYTEVKLGDSWVAVDIWGQRYGIKFGDYAHGFN